MYPGKATKSKDELEQDFRNVYQMLSNSLRLYDEGQFVEVARIASSIYVLVHDYGKGTKSLLTLLDRKNIPFFDSAGPLNPRNLLTEMPMVMMQITNNVMEYRPHLDDGPPKPEAWMQFSRWWDAPVLRDNRRRVLSRKNLVFAFRNTEGGGHVAPYFDEVFAALKRENSMGWVFKRGDDGVAPIGSPEGATMRQIGWEIDATLRRHCSDLLAHRPIGRIGEA
jgi:hypothetical protein